MGILILVTRCPAQGPAAEATKPESRVQFTFERTPWRSVLDWLAENAELSLYVGDLPTGSFTYSDTRAYTPDEAINRVNLFLIPQRYTLVRSGTLLSVISLDDDRSVRQLDAIAESVAPEKLANRLSHELVKCLFPLGTIEAERATEELSGLMLIRDPVVLQNTNQLLVIDTAAKLRMVQQILAEMSDPDAAAGPVKYFPLNGLDGERVLEQVRPHVGLDPLAMTGADIRLSVDVEGGQLLASGSVDNLDAVASVMKMLEERRESPVARKQLDFRTHPVGEANMQTVVSVLQTLLADDDVRMAPDVTSNRIAVMAIPKVHDVVASTIADLTGTGNKIEFKAIHVPVDPRYAVMVLNEMFVPSSPLDLEAERPDQADAPKISPDPFSGRIFVRAKASQIAEIEKAVQELGQPDLAQDPTLRLFPFRGERARQILDSAKEFWPHGDELQILPAADTSSPQPLEREVNPEPRSLPAGPRASQSPPSFEKSSPQKPGLAAGDSTASRRQSPALVATSVTLRLQEQAVGEHERPRIRVQQTPRGILVHADDSEALQRFEKHLQLIAGPDESTQRLAIFYLKHATSDEANRLLQRLLEAEEFATPVSRALGGREFPGSVVDVLGTEGLGRMWTVGTATIVPDKRLNRLFVYGTVADLLTIERHLEVIDRENSIARVATQGTPRVIQLKHTKAEAVAAVVRDAYAGRIAESARQRQQAAGPNQRPQQASPQGQRQASQSQPNAGNRQRADNQEAPPNASRQNRNQSAPDTSEQPKLTLAADPQSNSLVITAPDQLAEEVESLIRTLDEQGAQATQVITLTESSPAHVHETLRRLLGDELRSTAPSRSSPGSRSGSNNRFR